MGEGNEAQKGETIRAKPSVSVCCMKERRIQLLCSDHKSPAQTKDMNPEPVPSFAEEL
jgi:hypothetical protein